MGKNRRGSNRTIPLLFSMPLDWGGRPGDERGVGWSENVEGRGAGRGVKCESGVLVITSWQPGLRECLDLQCASRAKMANLWPTGYWPSWPRFLAGVGWPDCDDDSGTQGSTRRGQEARSVVEHPPIRDRRSLTIQALLRYHSESRLYECRKNFIFRRSRNSHPLPPLLLESRANSAWSEEAPRLRNHRRSGTIRLCNSHVFLSWPCCQPWLTVWRIRFTLKAEGGDPYEQT